MMPTDRHAMHAPPRSDGCAPRFGLLTILLSLLVCTAQAGPIVPHPVDADRFYAVRHASFDGGEDAPDISVTHGRLFGSVDGSASWLPITTDGINIRGVVVDPLQPERLYAWTFGAGILSSQDGGASWQAAGAPLGQGDVDEVLVSPALAGRIWARDRNGLYRSDDAGQSWSGVLARDDLVVVALSPADPDRVYAGTRDLALWESADAGQNWTLRIGPDALPAGFEAQSSWLLRADPLDADIVFAAFLDGAGGRDFRRLFVGEPDTGWRELLINTETTSVVDLEVSASGLGTLYVIMQNAPVLSANPVVPGLYRSEDRGASWQHSTIPATFGGNLTPWAGSPDTLFLYGGSYHRSVDGGSSWQTLDGPPAFDPGQAPLTDLALSIGPEVTSLTPGRRTVNVVLNNRGTQPAAGALVKVRFNLGNVTGADRLPARVDHEGDWTSVTKGGTDIFTGEFVISEQYVVLAVGTVMDGRSVTMPLQYDILAGDVPIVVEAQVLESAVRDTNAGNDLVLKQYTVSSSSGSGTTPGGSGGSGGGGGGGGASVWLALALLPWLRRPRRA